MAKDVEGVDMIAAADDLPVTDDNGKGLAFIIYGNNAEYLPLIRLFYPMGLEEPVKGVDGSTQFTSIKVTREQVASTRVSQATYKPASGDALERDEAGIGTLTMPLPQGMAFPVQAEWKSGLVAPQYGVYTFSLAPDASDATLELDGRAILQKGGTAGPKIDMVLAKGIHDIRVTGTLANANSKVEVTWSAANGTLNPIAAKYLYNGPTGGLSGELGPLASVGGDVLTAKDPYGTMPLTQLRSDPFVGFREASNLFTNASYLARWRGKLIVPSEGDYGFSFAANGQGVVMVDGNVVFGNVPGGAPSGGPAHLTAGQHDIEARYASPGGGARIELLWTPPDAQPAIIPPTNLLPLKRSWTKAEAPQAPAANLPPPQIAEAPVRQPEATFGSGDLSKPRGIAVDKEGNVYVGDRGNSRIVVYTPDGKVARTFGKAAEQPKEGAAAGPAQDGLFGDILDLGVGDDGTVYVDDSLSHLQAFTSQGGTKGSLGTEQIQISGA